MSGFQIRYRPDTPLGVKFPGQRYPWRGGSFPSREVAEDVRQQCFSADSMEVIEVDP